MDEIICKCMTEDILKILKSNQGYMKLIPERKALECEKNLKSWSLISLPKNKERKKQTHFSKGRQMAQILEKRCWRTWIYSVCLALSLEVGHLTVDGTMWSPCQIPKLKP